MRSLAITDDEFAQFQRFIHDAAGITLAATKKALVSGRLAKRVHQHGLTSYTQYLRLLAGGGAQEEVQAAIDLLTTNETYFFREAKHFDVLRELAQAPRPRGQALRVWSAASSTGEEAYSIAMVLADALGSDPWEVVGTDISSRVLQRARLGHYPLERTRHVPHEYLRRFCLRGIGTQAGTLLVDRSLRERVSFSPVNLNAPLPHLGLFDVIFLRNVMIYFNGDTKRQVVARVLSLLRPGGSFFIGHSESLHQITQAVVQVSPSVYRKP
jgi:chemotaxis protein methyltransferase CheR